MLSAMYHFGATAQNIYIDKPVLAGGLTLFPEISNPNNYYFLPNKIRLGTGTDGSPQFSFLMFVKNIRGEDGEAAPRQGDGGGVVHAVVELYVSDDERKDAERELRRMVRNDAATILGPVIYKGGTMSLISSIADPAGGYSKVVLGLGPAPVLAGNKAAVSILLNKEGAKILWETFKTPTPDMSFSFVMDVEGYRSPIAAWIDVNFDKVYESQTIEAGLKYRSGGGGNSNSQRQPANRNNNRTGGNGSTGGNSGGGNNNPPPARRDSTPPPVRPPVPPDTTETSGGGGTSWLMPEEEYPSGLWGNNNVALTSASILALNPFIDQLRETFQELQVPENEEIIVLEPSGDVAAYAPEGGVEGGGVYLDAEVQLMFEEMRQTGAIQVGGPQGDEKFEEIIKICYTKMLDMLFEPANNTQSPADMSAMINTANQLNRQSGNSRQDSAFNNNGGLKLSVAYKFKQVRKTGKFRMDLNRSMTDALKIRFDENVGNIKCPKCFRQINIDDPMFRQREILVSVDGMNSDQFKKYVNYVAVTMKKTHGNNEITNDEVRIGVADMEKTGNIFRLLYGWKDEKDAQKDKWLQYEYKETWSMFGNQVIESPWKPAENFVINVAPPLRPFAVDLEGSPDLLKQKEVRSANVKIYYNTGLGERMEQANIRSDAANTASRIEFVLPDGKYEYEYEITWRLSGNREVKTPRTKSSSTLLYVDELPK